MACSNCKKKKKEFNELKTKREPIIGIDRITTWLFIIWFFLGIYGLWSLIKLIKFFCNLSELR